MKSFSSTLTFFLFLLLCQQTKAAILPAMGWAAAGVLSAIAIEVGRDIFRDKEQFIRADAAYIGGCLWLVDKVETISSYLCKKPHPVINNATFFVGKTRATCAHLLGKVMPFVSPSVATVFFLNAIGAYCNSSPYSIVYKVRTLLDVVLFMIALMGGVYMATLYVSDEAAKEKAH